jgi:hypothetical protein
MKTTLYRTVLPLVGLFCFFFSCEEDTIDYGLGEYYQNIATVLSDSVYLLDSGETLYDVAYGAKKAREASKRFLLTYSILKERNTFYDHAIALHGASEITMGELKAVADTTIASFPAHSIRLESVWTSSHYLNMQFYFNYVSKTHSIGLLTDSSCLSDDTLRLYFKHDTNQDSPGYPVHLFLSFDLKKVLGEPNSEPAEKKHLQVNINSSNYADKTYKFNY